MNKFIVKFGEIVGDFVEEHPNWSLNMLRAGYGASLLKSRALPNKKLLLHQQYASVMSSEAILEPLVHPENSAVVNLFFPCEILHAMDISPQFAEGFASYLNGASSEQAFVQYAEDAGVPQTYCSYHKILLGAALSDVLPKPQFVATTSLTCDANGSTFRTISDHYHVPYYMVDVPNECTAETIEYVANQLREVTSMIEDKLGKKLDKDALKVNIKRYNDSLKLYKEHLSILKDKYMVSNITSEMFKIFPTHIMSGTQEAEKYFQLLLEDTKNAPRSNGEKRIFWVHTIPFWQESIRDMLNFSSKYQLLLCDLNVDYLEEMDPSQPYESMARRLLLNATNGSGENRANRAVEMAKYLNADGVVYFNHWGCKQTLGNAQLVSDLLSQEEIPHLILDGDGVDRNNVNDGQMVTKLQAFLEMMEVRAS